ncbi:MAG: oligoendopeptidase F, partial [Candidatus Zixiibacteriota bacterium]
MRPSNRLRTFMTMAIFSSFLIPAATQAAMPKTKVRAEIDAKYRWNFSDIYPSWDAWEKDRAVMEQKMADYAALKGTLSGGAQNVLKAYKINDEMNIIAYKVYRYPQLQRDVDTRDNDISAKLQQVQMMFAKFGTATAWFSPELLSIKWETMKKWLDETPELEPYRFTISNLYRQQEHVLDENGE